MGNYQTVTSQPSYAVVVKPQENEHQTSIYRAASHPDELITNFVDYSTVSAWNLFQRGSKYSPKGHCLGRRVVNLDGSLGKYKWSSYREVEQWATRLGSALMEKGLCPVSFFPEEKFPTAQSMRLIGIFAKNRIEWLITEQAANAFGLTLVPLYDTLGEEATSYVLDQTDLTTAFCSLECMPSLLKACRKTSKLKNIVCYDKTPADLAQKLKNDYDITLHDYEELISWPRVLPLTPGTGDTIATLCYTSGTTGNPKGVLLSQGGFTSVISAVVRGPLAGGRIVDCNEIHISYLPLPHVYERAICNVMFAVGASIGVYSGDTLKLLDDVRELKPTLFVSVPRLFNRINDKVFGGVKEKSAVAQYLFNAGMNAKLATLRADATVVHGFWDSLVFRKIGQLMGGRLRMMIAGGAPLDALIEDRMKVLFSCPLIEGYGLSETLGTSFITNPIDPISGHVGGVIPSLEFVIESVPEMDYHVTDEEPRGELLVRGPGLCKGYFRNLEEWERAVDKDGWFHTGDIAVLLPTKAIKIIDRKKNIFKLAQGEYIAPEKIEATYQQASLVGQTFVFGYSTENALVAIVVPDAEMAAKWAVANGLEGVTVEALCVDSLFKKAVATELDQAGRKGGLKGFETIKEFTLRSEPFSTESGLLTPTFKIRRHEARAVFIKEIDAMYSKLRGAHTDLPVS